MESVEDSEGWGASVGVSGCAPIGAALDLLLPRINIFDIFDSISKWIKKKDSKE